MGAPGSIARMECERVDNMKALKNATQELLEAFDKDDSAAILIADKKIKEAQAALGWGKQ